MMTLERAISIASEAHEGQLDKGGEPYILHPLRVMMKLHNVDQKIVAVLHDVLEDTHVKDEDLLVAGISLELLNHLLTLTRRNNESYDEYLDRICEDPFDIEVKLADLEDNMDMSRLKNPTEKDFNRLLKYGKAQDKLRQVLFENAEQR